MEPGHLSGRYVAVGESAERQMRRGSGKEEMRTLRGGGNEQQIAAMFARRVLNESKMEGGKSTMPIMERWRAEEADCLRFSLRVAGDEGRLLPCI